MLSPKLIVAIVANHFGLTRAQLVGRRRLPRIVLARHVGMLLSLEMVRGASLNGVGLSFGGRHHTSVLYAQRRMHRQIAGDRRFAREVEALRRIIGKAG